MNTLTDLISCFIKPKCQHHILSTGGIQWLQMQNYAYVFKSRKI